MRCRRQRHRAAAAAAAAAAAVARRIQRREIGQGIVLRIEVLAKIDLSGGRVRRAGRLAHRARLRTTPGLELRRRLAPLRRRHRRSRRGSTRVAVLAPRVRRALRGRRASLATALLLRPACASCRRRYVAALRCERRWWLLLSPLRSSKYKRCRPRHCCLLLLRRSSSAPIQV